MNRTARASCVLSLLLSLPLQLALARDPENHRPSVHRDRGLTAAATGGTLVARFLDASSGAPLAGLESFITDVITERQFYFPQDVSGADGTITFLNVPEGEYFLNAYPTTVGAVIVDTWYPDVWNFDFHNRLRSATPIRITTGTTTNIEMRFASGTQFVFEMRNGSGQPIDITSQDPFCTTFFNGVNLGRIYFDAGGSPLLDATTFNCGLFLKAGTGSYAAYAIPVGRKMWMQFWPENSDFLPRFHDGKVNLGESMPLTAASVGQVRIPIVLTDRGPSISGRGRLQSTTVSTVLQRNVRLWDGGNQRIRIHGVAPDGSVTLAGLPDGDYKVQFFLRGRNAPNPAFNLSKFHQNSSSVAGATPISIRGSNVTGIDVLLDTPADVAQVAGDWGGTYSDSISCGGTNFTSSGNALFNLTQFGTNVSGSATLIDRKNISTACAATGTTTITGSLSGTLNGTALTGTFATTLGNLPLSGNFSAGSFLGTLTYPNGTSTLSLKSGLVTRIDSFTATPATIRLGGSSTLSWRTFGTPSVSISGVSGQQPANGSVVVQPSSATTYTLTAGASTAPPTAQVTVEVVAQPNISVAAFPGALLQLVGESGATTTYTLQNSGGASSSINLEQSGSFFTQEPASFTLAPGASQLVTIRATQQPAGSYEGRSTPRGLGVPPNLSIPIRLLVTVPPASGTATAQVPTNRVDVATPPSQQLVPGTLMLSNAGTATLVGILSSDVPWLTFANPTVSIAPGQTVTIEFTIDRSQRPDAAAPVGSVTGTLRLTYLGGTGASKGLTPSNGGSVTSSTTVTIVDTAKPPTNTGVIPPLVPGEVARFIPRVAHLSAGGNQLATDFTVARTSGASTVSDLRLFYASTSQSPVTVANLGALAPNQSLFFGNIVSSIFGKQGETGTVQFRSVDWDKLAVQARVVTLGAARAGLGADVPVFRSDRAAGAGEKLYFAGLQRTPTIQGSLYLQEAAGYPASVAIEFLNAAGAMVESRLATSISPFGLLELSNAVPSGAVAAVVSISETSGGRVVGYAAMNDSTTGDSWNIPDWAQFFGYKTTEPVRIPLAESPSRRRRGARRAGGAEVTTAARTDLTLFNPGSSAVSATVTFADASGRLSSKSFSVAPRATTTISDVVAALGAAGRGSLIVTPTSGAIVVSPGLVSSNHTASVPALPASLGLKAGDLLSFSNLEDSSLATIQAKSAGTLRTSFGILETGGKGVKVRATLTYADGKTPVAPTLAHDFTIAANQQSVFDSIAAAVIGPSRATLGDLRNIRVTFQIVEGEGTAAIFVRSTDNASGDSIVRVE